MSISVCAFRATKASTARLDRRQFVTWTTSVRAILVSTTASALMESSNMSVGAFRATKASTARLDHRQSRTQSTSVRAILVSTTASALMESSNMSVGVFRATGVSTAKLDRRQSGTQSTSVRATLVSTTASALMESSRMTVGASLVTQAPIARRRFREYLQVCHCIHNICQNNDGSKSKQNAPCQIPYRFTSKYLIVPQGNLCEKYKICIQFQATQLRSY